MSYAWKAAAGLGTALILSGELSGQGLVVQKNLPLAMAKTIAEATIAECKSKGYNTSAAVVREMKPARKPGLRRWPTFSNN